MLIPLKASAPLWCFGSPSSAGSLHGLKDLQHLKAKLDSKEAPTPWVSLPWGNQCQFFGNPSNFRILTTSVLNLPPTHRGFENEISLAAQWEWDWSTMWAQAEGTESAIHRPICVPGKWNSSFLKIMLYPLLSIKVSQAQRRGKGIKAAD